MKKVNELFGSLVFNDSVMRERLPEDVYYSLKNFGIDSHIADTVAAAMKDWAIEKGATHYTHWFQPMTGITAEKHRLLIISHLQTALYLFIGSQFLIDKREQSLYTLYVIMPYCLLAVIWRSHP